MNNKVFGSVLFIGMVTLMAQSSELSQEEISKYYQTDSMVTQDGKVVDIVTISGPSIPPVGVSRSVINYLSNSNNNIESTSLNSIGFLEVPAFSWSFGCSATSAAMIAGYYDRHGYPNIYTGPTNNGKMPLDNSAWPDWTDSSGHTRHQTPLSATHDGLDGRVGRGHVDDYWVKYGSSDDDPFITNGWDEHRYGDCTADFMKTNQTTNYGNSDGATTIYYYSNGTPLTAKDMEDGNIADKDGAYGFKLFFESRGYKVTTLYTQVIDSIASGGFTFEQYKEEIDSGYPVMIHLKGHTIVGVGYDDTNDTVYLHDTWDYDTHSMTWGGSYAGMQQQQVTIIHLVPNIKKDFNKDGIPDILWRNDSNGANRVWLMDHNGTHTTINIGKMSTVFNVVTINDINGDGISDIVWRKDNGVIRVWFMHEDYTHSSTAVAKVSDTFKIYAIEDFNGDGILDMFLRNDANGANRIWIMNKDWSSHTVNKPVKLSNTYHIAEVGDFNKDGIADIFWRKDTGRNVIWLMNSDGITHKNMRVTKVSPEYQVAGLNDFNGDGITDIFWRNDSNGANRVWLMNSDGTHHNINIGKFSTSYRVISILDMNGDGITDIFWRNDSNGANRVWLMNSDGTHHNINIGKFSTNYKPVF